MFNLLCIVILLQKTDAQDISAITDLKTLSELPLEKLLQLKNNFDPKKNVLENEISAKLDLKGNGPEALPLHSNPNMYNRGGHNDYHGGHDDYHGDKHDNKKDASTIFQFSVTTLSFVAFGGYLLCLIIQAIRAKNAAMTTTTTTAVPIMLIRPFRNGQLQLSNPTRNPRPTKHKYKREVVTNLNSEYMYDALLMLAEGYSKYHTVDYKTYNKSSIFAV